MKRNKTIDNNELKNRESNNNFSVVSSSIDSRYSQKYSWRWKSTAGGVFSTKSAYEVCAKAKGEQTFTFKEEIAQIWTAPAPHKARVTAWRVICNRLPTCQNLIKRNVSIGEEEKGCNACMTREETTDHTFLQCPKTDLVWDQIQQWINVKTAKPQQVADHFNSFIGGGRGRKNRNFLKALWIGTVWQLWKHRNDSRWGNKNWEVLALVRDIKGRMWSWNKMFQIVESNVPFSKWCSNEYSPLV